MACDLYGSFTAGVGGDVVEGNVAGDGGEEAGSGGVQKRDGGRVCGGGGVLGEMEGRKRFGVGDVLMCGEDGGKRKRRDGGKHERFRCEEGGREALGVHGEREGKEDLSLPHGVGGEKDHHAVQPATQENGAATLLDGCGGLFLQEG